MTRRDANWLLTRAAATVAGQSFFASWLAAAHEHGSAAPPEPDRWKDYKPQFFSPEQFRILDFFTSILIPTDSTPGAREAHVAPFLDFLIFSAAEYAPETQADWRNAVAWLETRQFGKMTGEQQLALVEQMCEPGAEGFTTFRLIKQMTVFAFYTSRVGLIDNLEYKGLAYLTEFPACNHPEHRKV